MYPGDAINKAIEIIRNTLKDNGLSDKSFRFDWWTNNGHPAIFITFANDLDENNNPIINDEYDPIEISSSIMKNIDKISTVDDAIKMFKNKISYNKKSIRDEYEDLINYDFTSEEVKNFYKYYDKFIEVISSL